MLCVCATEKLVPILKSSLDIMTISFLINNSDQRRSQGRLLIPVFIGASCSLCLAVVYLNFRSGPRLYWNKADTH